MKFQIVLTLFAVASISSANLLVNGSFESPLVDSNSQRNEWTTGQSIGGWNVVAADTTVEQLSNPYTDMYGGDFWWKTPAGDQFIYLGSYPTVSEIRQDVSLATGDYTLSFLQCAFHGDFGTGEGAVTADVLDSNGNSLLGGAQTSTTAPHADWGTVTYSFSVANAGTYGIDFLSTSGMAGNIDDVRLNPVPEPASLAALGIGAIAVIRRRKRS
jgi:hypothetical protein